MSLLTALSSMCRVEPVAPGMKGADGWRAVHLDDGTRVLMASRRDASYKEAVRDGLLWEDLEFPQDVYPMEEAILTDTSARQVQSICYVSEKGGRSAPSKSSYRKPVREAARRKANKHKHFVPRRNLELIDAEVNTNTALCTTCNTVQPCPTLNMRTHISWCIDCRITFLRARYNWNTFTNPTGCCLECWAAHEKTNVDWYQSGDLPWSYTTDTYIMLKPETVKCLAHYDPYEDDDWQTYDSYDSYDERFSLSRRRRRRWGRGW